MPRISQDVLLGYKPRLERRNGIEVDQSGEERVVEVNELTFTCPVTQHQVLIAMGDEERRALASLLAGGLVLPS